MLEGYRERRRIGRVIGMAIAAVVLVCMGLGEFGACVRWMFPPTKVAYADASAKGLGDFGHVEFTDAKAGNAFPVVHAKSGRVWGFYVALHAADPTTVVGASRVVAFLPDARTPQDVVDFVTTHGFEGFVDTTAEMKYGSEREEIRTASGSNDPANCWIVTFRKPSLLKGLGLFGGGVAIAGVLVFMMSRNKPE